MNAEQAAKLRAPFLKEQIGKLPKPYSSKSDKGNCKECGGYHGLPAVHLDYVGHAATTDRLLQVDPAWYWEPVAFDADGMPKLDAKGGLWIKLTVCGVTRFGYGDLDSGIGGKGMKELIGDAIRNAAMRFGVALDLWSKEDLQPKNPEGEPEPPPKADIPGAKAKFTDAKTVKDIYAAWGTLTAEEKADAGVVAEFKRCGAALQKAEKEAADAAVG